jgi:dTMP kinase
LKYHEAGLDMGWSTDPYESFRIFQGKVAAEYTQIKEKFHFTTIDAIRDIHDQQTEVRRIISEAIDLPSFKR